MHDDDDLEHWDQPDGDDLADEMRVFTEPLILLAASAAVVSFLLVFAAMSLWATAQIIRAIF